MSLFVVPDAFVLVAPVELVLEVRYRRPVAVEDGVSQGPRAIAKVCEALNGELP